ncbi:hypothetical protein BDFG_05782 [Blastomyces dermatitidis ATCC 26199]|nr:hypothetical protein BDFG_05782 [Blastomyces dermatitidis ATCC 26199]
MGTGESGSCRQAGLWQCLRVLFPSTHPSQSAQRTCQCCHQQPTTNNKEFNNSTAWLIRSFNQPLYRTFISLCKFYVFSRIEETTNDQEDSLRTHYLTISLLHHCD